MPVVGDRLLFCEGTGGGRDSRLLSRLVEGAPGWTIIPAGSKVGLRHFAEGYRRRGREGSWLAIRDRDFDLEPSEVVGLLRGPSGGERVWCLHRTAIENYALDPELLHNYWREFSEGPNGRRHTPLEDGERIAQRLERAARELADYQAIRWALAGARHQQVHRIATTWTRGSGDLPKNLSWDECYREAEQLVSSEGDRDPAERFRQKADALRERFRDDAFYRAGAYKVWFSGKDVFKMMQRQDPKLFLLEAFVDAAMDQIHLEAHLDLEEFREKLKNPPPSPP